MTFEEILPKLKAGHKGQRNGYQFYMEEGFVRYTDLSGPFRINFDSNNYELVPEPVITHQYLYQDSDGDWCLTSSHYASYEEAEEAYTEDCINFQPAECTTIEEKI